MDPNAKKTALFCHRLSRKGQKDIAFDFFKPSQLSLHMKDLGEKVFYGGQSSLAAEAKDKTSPAVW